MNEKKVAPSRELAAKVIFEALKILSESGGEMRLTEIIKKIGETVTFDEWATTVYEKTGYIRWQSMLHFFSIDCVKAGLLIKRRGVWFITPEGESAMNLGPKGLLDEASRKYREWSKERDRNEVPHDVDKEEGEDVDAGARDLEMSFEQIQTKALDSIIEAITTKNPYEFQELAAALLRGMGYFTPFVAPRGKDGGVDIMAYRDPLGTQSPRIKVQIKHRESTSTPVTDVRQLMGLLQKDGDVGIFFSTGGFTPDAKSTARSSHVHVELIDLERFIDLWRQFYEKLTDEDKAMLPLTPVYFIAPPS